MEEKMRLLKELQWLDTQAGKMRTELKELQDRQAGVDQEADRLQEMFDSLTQELKELRAVMSELNRNLEQEQQNIERSEKRLPEIKTQKEYLAILKEVDTAKKLCKEFEDQILAKQGTLESLTQDCAEKTAELKSARTLAAGVRKEVQDKIENTAKDLAARDEECDALRAKLPAPLAKRYKLLFERREGLAVVEAKNGACYGCHMHLPPQLYNKLFNLQQVESCPQCNRLLYVEDRTA